MPSEKYAMKWRILHSTKVTLRHAAHDPGFCNLGECKSHQKPTFQEHTRMVYGRLGST